MTIHMMEVDMEDIQSFLELVYTGRVRMREERRKTFTSLMEVHFSLGFILHLPLIKNHLGYILLGAECE